jgi:hypothetical protein
MSVRETHKLSPEEIKEQKFYGFEDVSGTPFETLLLLPCAAWSSSRPRSCRC